MEHQNRAHQRRLTTSLCMIFQVLSYTSYLEYDLISECIRLRQKVLADIKKADYNKYQEPHALKTPKGTGHEHYNHF